MVRYLTVVVAVLVTGSLWLGEFVIYNYLLHDDIESFSNFVASQTVQCVIPTRSQHGR